jgi:hypothetical protein
VLNRLSTRRSGHVYHYYYSDELGGSRPRSPIRNKSKYRWPWQRMSA